MSTVVDNYLTEEEIDQFYDSLEWEELAELNSLFRNPSSQIIFENGKAVKEFYPGGEKVDSTVYLPIAKYDKQNAEWEFINNELHRESYKGIKDVLGWIFS